MIWGDGMSILTSKTSSLFDECAVALGDLVRAKYHTWDEPRNGLVVDVKADALMVLFIPKVHHATRYFIIKPQEVADGKWHILISSDLKTISEEGSTDEESGSSDSQAATGK